MSRKRRQHVSSDVVQSPASPLGRRKWLLSGLIVLAAACLAAVIASRLHDKNGAAASPPVLPSSPPANRRPRRRKTLCPRASARNSSAVWRRADANYVLEIHRIAADGQIDAAYFNPRPIHVSKALAMSEAGRAKVMVELRDRLYPGSFYTLTYNPPGRPTLGRVPPPRRPPGL